MKYDSTNDTLDHIESVRNNIRKCIGQLFIRIENHDKSKLESPEKEIFDEYTPKLRDTTYDSDEYREYLKGMKIGLDHHYANNSHHPEFYGDGIKGMSLIDIVEMLCDWKSASERHTDGDILSSIEKNQKRFGYSDDLKQILINTVKVLEIK